MAQTFSSAFLPRLLSNLLTKAFVTNTAVRVFWEIHQTKIWKQKNIFCSYSFCIKLHCRQTWPAAGTSVASAGRHRSHTANTLHRRHSGDILFLDEYYIALCLCCVHQGDKLLHQKHLFLVKLLCCSISECWFKFDNKSRFTIWNGQLKILWVVTRSDRQSVSVDQERSCWDGPRQREVTNQ